MSDLPPIFDPYAESGENGAAHVMRVSAALLASPTVTMISDKRTIWQLNASPYDRWVSNGTTLIPLGSSSQTAPVPLGNFGTPIGGDWTAVFAAAFAARANIQLPQGSIGVRPGVLNLDYTAFIQGFGALSQIVPLAGGTTGAPVLNIARTANTPASNVNNSGQLLGPVLQHFQIRDSRSIDCVGIKIGAVDEIKAYGVTCYGLVGGAWLYDSTKAVRECEFYSCYDWFCGDSTRPSTSIVSMNTGVTPAFGCVDQHNGLYYYGCKTVYPYGTGLLLDSLDATAANATRLAVWTNCHWEGQFYTITNGVGHTAGDLVWARQSGYGIAFVNCQNGNPDGYAAGVSSGWACYRLGEKAANRTAQHIVISGGQIGNWVTPSTGGPGIVDEQCLYLSLTGGLEVLPPFPDNNGLVLGALPHNAITPTANSLNQRVSVDLSVQYLDQFLVRDPGGEFARIYIGKYNSDNVQVLNFVRGKISTNTAFVAGSTGSPTGTLTFYDSTGTAYRVDCKV